MQRDNALKLISQMCAPIRLTLREGLFSTIISVREMINACEQAAEIFAVVDDATN